MLETIELGRLRNGEYLQSFLDILSHMPAGSPVALALPDAWARMNNITQKIEGVFKTPLGSLITAELEAIDLRRDSAYLGIRSIVNGNTYSIDADKKQAALVLQDHLDMFGKVAEDNYQSETASVRNILTDWATKHELANAVTALGLADWVAEMQAANDLFTTRYQQRSSISGNSQTEMIRELRVEGNAAFFELRDNLNAHFIINKGAAPWGSTLNAINGTIADYNQLISRRSTKGDDGSEVAETAPAVAS